MRTCVAARSVTTRLCLWELRNPGKSDGLYAVCSVALTLRRTAQRNLLDKYADYGVLCSTDYDLACFNAKCARGPEQKQMYIGWNQTWQANLVHQPSTAQHAVQTVHQLADEPPQGICPQTAGAKVLRYWRWSARWLNIGIGAIHPWRRGASKHCGRASLLG